MLKEPRYEFVVLAPLFLFRNHQTYLFLHYSKFKFWSFFAVKENQSDVGSYFMIFL